MFARNAPAASAKLGFALATMLTAGACAAALAPATLAPLPTQISAPAVSAESVEHRHEVLFAIDRAEFSPGELARLYAFLAQLPAGSTRRFRLVAHADEPAGEVYNLDLSARRARAVEREMRARLPPRDEVATLALGEPSPTRLTDAPGPFPHDRRVDILATTYLVRLPSCPDWSRDPGSDPLNHPLSNLGCANATNLGLMVADPADLARGRNLGPADATREAEAVVRYRSDKVKELRDEAIRP